MRTAVANKGEAFSFDCGCIDADERKAFLVENRNIFGTGLVCALTQKVEEYRARTTTQSFQSDGNFFDDEDLCDTYKNKPLQLKNILEKAKTIECPQRGVTLYEQVDSCSQDFHLK